uniref:Adenylate cyclase n=1 Tax=Candidatus Kentrum sp. TUN TaxID=2126343 RepID=A0A450ZKH9_9GAMM|nr:MAG: adenylate cyclase [Candidatus Kentron sp. TUN]VFK56264.1 MAG: adenylate cyclase [Candidatus Kentron sp. TUN]
MPTEIERKFLIRNDDWRQQASKGTRYRQGYFPNSKTCSVRVRIAGDKATLNIKGATLNVSREEYEYSIPQNDAEEMLTQFCERPFIEKTRYLVENGNHVWEIDVFEGENTGLIVAEIELSHEDEEFELPSWVGRDVSHETRYYNVCLREHPYKDW